VKHVEVDAAPVVEDVRQDLGKLCQECENNEDGGWTPG
jgi:hypothetical protein